jgi:uncharacterized protein
MLLIPTYIAPSNIHGVGLYSKIRIKKGQRVYVFDPETEIDLTRDELLGLPIYTQIELYDHMWKNTVTGKYCCSSGNARVINHSSHPNLSSFYMAIYGAEGIMVHEATRRIDPGDELTRNYNDFDVLDESEGNVWSIIEREAEFIGYDMGDSTNIDFYKQ